MRVWPTRVHSSRIWRTVAFSVFSVTRPSLMVSCTCCANAGLTEPARSSASAAAERGLLNIDDLIRPGGVPGHIAVYRPYREFGRGRGGLGRSLPPREAIFVGRITATA